MGKSVLLLGVVFVCGLLSLGLDTTPFVPEEVKDYVVAVGYETKYESSILNDLLSDRIVGGSGVIIDNSDGVLTVFTNRHVVDCGFQSGYCNDVSSERGVIRTRGGSFYEISEVGLLKDASSVDLAILKVPVPDAESYAIPEITKEFVEGEIVTAIGYPSYANRVVMFSVSSGEITNIKRDLYFINDLEDWRNFVAIESDAYTYFGSSGGGLFNSKGELIGINTWGDSANGKSIAIQAVTMNSFEESDFVFCKKNTSYFSEGSCVPYRRSFVGGDYYSVEDFKSKVVEVAEEEESAGGHEMFSANSMVEILSEVSESSEESS